ncbi:MAG TPA: hypothetical protein VF631_01460 [Allosphingosinicella sp.]|jgi:HTH-type transcriptional regulator/antitoxin HigA|uniref:helix-turn-helix domain-containing protein n=1 Tax=Allosphingosinicella sp. TaxID=2823234 RepID=UPI002F2A703E
MVPAKPLRSERDYDAALAEIETLLTARAGTAEGDRLDSLTTLIQAYEAETHRIAAPDPIALIEVVMEQRGLAVGVAAFSWAVAVGGPKCWRAIGRSPLQPYDGSMSDSACQQTRWGAPTRFRERRRSEWSTVRAVRRPTASRSRHLRRNAVRTPQR